MKAIGIMFVVLTGLCAVVMLSKASEEKRDGAGDAVTDPPNSSIIDEKKAMDVSLTAEEIALARSLHAAPPWGIPDRYPPGPERDTVLRKMYLWSQERRSAVHELREKISPTPPEILERRRIWANATRIDKEIPGSGRKPVPYVRDEDLPPEERERHLKDLPRIAQVEQELREKTGPSKLLIRVVGDRPTHELRQVYRLLLETSFDVPPVVKLRGFGTEQHRINYIRECSMKMGIELTENGIRELMAVKPVQKLWTKD